MNFLINEFVDLCVKCRTACKYPGKKIAFHVNEGSTPFWLSLLVEFEDAEGDIGTMHIREVRIFFFLLLPYNLRRRKYLLQ
jgi:hypothetical protein